MQAPQRLRAEDFGGDMSDYFTGSDWSQTYAKKALPVLVNLAESHRVSIGQVWRALERPKSQAIRSIRRRKPNKNPANSSVYSSSATPDSIALP
jgi:hypothetical protein